MSEKPILFSGPMVRAILEGRKTQTRRVVKPQPELYMQHRFGNTQLVRWKKKVDTPLILFPTCMKFRGMCPYGDPGSRLWVRETWIDNWGAGVIYRADYGPDSYEGGAKGWRPSIYMPRWASRLDLEITAVRVERVQDISEADIRSEGFDPDDFSDAWDAMNAKRGYSWASNPWVWVIEFRMVQL